MTLRRCSATGCFTKLYSFYPQQAVAPTFCRLLLYSLSVVCILFSKRLAPFGDSELTGAAIAVTFVLPSRLSNGDSRTWIRRDVDRMSEIPRVMKRLSLTGILLLFASFTLAHSTARAQEGPNSSADPGSLPNAPLPTQATSQLGPNGPQRAGTGEISGTVLDTNGDVVQGAQVTLAGSAGSIKRTVVSGSDGQFAFTGLPLCCLQDHGVGSGYEHFHLIPNPLASGSGSHCASRSPCLSPAGPPA